jgi:hypothetical protein
MEAIAGAQMTRADGTEAVLGVGFGSDADFHAMVNELIAGVEECRDGREIDAIDDRGYLTSDAR